MLLTIRHCEAEKILLEVTVRCESEWSVSDLQFEIEKKLSIPIETQHLSSSSQMHSVHNDHIMFGNSAIA